MLFHLILYSFIMAQSYQTQPYEVISTLDKIEIRYYPPAMMVKVASKATNNRNFNALFRYISGNNVSKEKIAMTTPVYMENKGEEQTMAFVLPENYTDTAPQPVGKESKFFSRKRAILPPCVMEAIPIVLKKKMPRNFLKDFS